MHRTYCRRIPHYSTNPHQRSSTTAVTKRVAARHRTVAYPFSAGIEQQFDFRHFSNVERANKVRVVVKQAYPQRRWRPLRFSLPS
jgi:hypothetical protein